MIFGCIMSDLKRSQSSSVGTCKESANDDAMNKKVIRLNLVLSDSNKEWCPVFNYEGVIRQIQVKKEEHSELLWSKNQNGSSLFLSEKEEEKDSLKRISNHLEQKYVGKDNRKRCQTYTELGAGYDENDSFIDNTEACEELLQDEIQRKHDGYYINCERFDRIVISDFSDQETEIRIKNKKPGKRIADSDDEYFTEDTNKKTKLFPEVNDTFEGCGNLCQTQGSNMKENQKKSDVRKSKTVKILLKEKRLAEVSNDKIGDQNVIPEPKKSNEDLKTVSDVIESVINAFHSDDESTRDSHLSIASGFQSGSLFSSDSEISNSGVKSIPQQQEIPPVLPDGISQEIRMIIENLIATAGVSKKSDKMFFTSAVNAMILRLEHSCRGELTPSLRNMVYTHLAHFLPCSKSTLVTRGKKLVLGQGDSEIDTLILKLKPLVDNATSCFQGGFLYEKNLEIKLKELMNCSSDIICENDSSKDPSAISKAFIWNDPLRNYLQDIVRLKVRQFKITHGRKETLDIYIQHFLSDKILPIWPKGMMTTALLLKHCSDAVYDEAKLCSVTATSKKITVSPITDGSVGISKYSGKSSPDSAPSPEIIHHKTFIELNKDDYNSVKSGRINDHTNTNKNDCTKVPLKKKKAFTGLIKEPSLIDDEHHDDEKCNASVTSNVRTDNVLDKELHIAAKVSTSKGSPTSPGQKTWTTDKDLSHLLIQKNEIGIFTNGVDQKPESEMQNEKLHVIPAVNEELIGNCAQELMSQSEVERRLHEETTAATDILSQLITDHSISQFVGACGSDDKVQMQLNEVMQDLVVLNQMSANTVNVTETNNGPGASISTEQKEEIRMQGMASFQEEFYSHIRKEALRQQITEISDAREPFFHDESHNNDSQVVQFCSQVRGKEL